MSTAFAAAIPIPRAPLATRAVCQRRVPQAKKRSGGGKKRGKSARSPQSSKPSSAKKGSSIDASAQPKPSRAPPPDAEDAFPGPVAPPVAPDSEEDVLMPLDGLAPHADAEIVPPSDAFEPQQDPVFDVESETAIPVQSEAKLKLPDLGAAGARGVKRKRKPRAAPGKSGVEGKEADKEGEETTLPYGTTKEAMPFEKVRELAAAYRRGGEEAETLIEEMEKDPDFMFQTGNPEGEYDLASGILGTGRPNKQGLYVLPYLQSGHVLLLLIILLCTFVYYPGFPLTELEDSARLLLKEGLALTYAFNAFLAVFAFREAKKRKQPAAFWAFKTGFLGNLALNELKRNAPLQEEE